MRRLVLISLGAALVFVVAACGGSGPQAVPANGVAVVGDATITKAEWDALIAQTKRNFAATKKPFPQPGTVDLANLKTNATQFLIQSSEYKQEADKLGVKVTDQDVQARLDQIKKQYYGNPAGQKQATPKQMEQRYQEALKQQGFTDQEVRQGISVALIREDVFKKVTKDVKVSDDEIQTYYDKNKQQYATPAQPESRDVRHILLGCTTKATCAKAKKKADDIYAQLQADPSKFAALAKKYSTDTSSARNGGKLPPGTAVKGRLVPEFEKVAFSIKENVISKPVKSQFGWHIIEALGPIKPGTPAKPTPLPQVKEPIRQQLLSQDKQKEMDTWLAGIKKDYCKTIGYQNGYAPPPGQDPCKTSSTTTGTATTTG
ncbi:MAG TPA: peptidylprolyl isomerase [Gaiellaceae bacterium]|nr:peptidylprolyl isomerase [Gaiellaceae bacterium]